MSVRFVYLDAAGTLIRAKGSVGEIYAEIGLAHGIRRDPFELSQAFQHEFRKRGPLAFPGVAARDIQQVERTWWKNLVRDTLGGNDGLLEFDAYFEQLYEAFSSCTRWQLFPDTIETLTQLQRAGYRLGVLSNFDSRLKDILEGLQIFEYFEVVMISSLVGSAKPSTEIFKLAAERAGHPPSRLAHIGDRIVDDFRGAQDSGWTGFLIDRECRIQGIEAKWRLQSLTELPKRLVQNGLDLEN